MFCEFLDETMLCSWTNVRRSDISGKVHYCSKSPFLDCVSHCGSVESQKQLCNPSRLGDTCIDPAARVATAVIPNQIGAEVWHGAKWRSNARARLLWVSGSPLASAEQKGTLAWHSTIIFCTKANVAYVAACLSFQVNESCHFNPNNNVSLTFT